MPRSHQQTRGGALTTVPVQTRAGVFTAHFSDRGLAQLDFPNGGPATARPSAAKLAPELQDWINLTEKAVSAVMTGQQPQSLPPLDLRAGTIFQQRVWAALQKISPGESKSYSEVASAIGSPKAVRAVGGACGANPIPVLVPCHRVLASGGKLGGFSGGLDWKKRLLAVEGILTQRRKGAVAQELFGTLHL